MGFVDLHAHILPGLDDGPATMEESLAMARAAGQDGTEIILATPHRRDVVLGSSVERLRDLLGELNEALEREARAGGKAVKVLPGMENHIEAGLTEWVAEGSALPMAGTRFVLCEPPYTAYPPYADDVLYRLQLARHVPVVAHPERNSVLRESHARLRGMVERGMLLQLSAGSFLGEYGPQVQRAAESLLRHGLVHMVASDMHGLEPPRSPLLGQAYRRVADLAGEAEASRLFDQIPRQVVLGRDPRIAAGERRRWSPARLLRRS